MALLSVVTSLMTPGKPLGDGLEREDVADLADDHRQDDRRADDADLLEHRLERHARRHPLADREMPPEHQGRVADDRDEDQPDLVLPADAPIARAMIPPSTSPPGHPRGACFRYFVFSRGNSSPPPGWPRPRPCRSQGEDERAEIEEVVGVRARRGEHRRQDRQDRRADVAEEREGHRLAVADLVDDQAEQHDADRERPEPRRR